MVAVPKATPVTRPEVELIVAFPGESEVQTPPGATSLNEVVAAGQTIAVPLILPALGSGFIVTTVVAATLPQPFVTV